MIKKKYEIEIYQIADDVTKCISGIKNILYGTNDQEPQTEVIAQLSQEIYNANLIKIMIDNIIRVDFHQCFVVADCYVVGFGFIVVYYLREVDHVVQFH